jgi:hypothetical protein
LIRHNPDEIKPESTLQADLRIYGDDAVDILESFSEKFNLDLHDFIFDDYFKAEGSSFFTFLEKQRKDLLVLDLINAALAGKLDDSVISANKGKVV